MRIKCPNSDVYLELPGDRTDMKFSCPACHKVHRVTVSIFTPGEDPAPAPKNTRSMVREQAQIPKKYATGAYAPVVDIPIDANFILMDGVAKQQGIDLGGVGDPTPPFVDRELSERQTEIIDRRREAEKAKAAAPASPTPDSPNPASMRADSEDTVRDESVADSRPEGRRLWDEVPDSPKAPPPTSARMSKSARTTATPKRRSAGRAVLLAILLALFAGGGFLAWQHQLYANSRKEVDARLAWAESAWKNGEIAGAATAAREAGAALRQGHAYLTPTGLWNRLAAWSGAFGPIPDDTAVIDAKVRAHLHRDQELESFTRSLDPASSSGMAETLSEAVQGPAAGDAPLAEAMGRAVVRAALDNLRDRAATVPPEKAMDAADEERRVLSPVLSPAALAGFDEGLKRFGVDQRQRLVGEIRTETAAVAKAAAAGRSDTLDRYLVLAQRLGGRENDPELSKPIPDLATEPDRAALRQLSRLAELVNRATGAARSVLSRQDDDESPLDSLKNRAVADNLPNQAMATQAGNRIDAIRAQADELISLRSEVFGRVQEDMRRNRDYLGSRLAWSMLRTGFADPQVEIDPAGFRYDSNRAAMAFTIRGIPASMAMTGDDYEKRIRANVGGYTFATGWSLLFHKPLAWMADLAVAMHKAGVSRSLHPEWELLEGPGGPLALSLSTGGASVSAAPSLKAEAGGRWMFFAGKLRQVTELPQSGDAGLVVKDFLRAAERLHDGVMADASIPQPLRQALKPVLMGTYQRPDPRDYFDSAFCRRLIEANYLESSINPLPPERRRELEAYRAALGKLEAGRDEFAVAIDGGRLVAVAALEVELGVGENRGDQDPETGESIPPYTWRVERRDATVFYSPLPARFVYAFMLAEHYGGQHRTKPVGRPRLTEVWHATKGRVASYAYGAAKAEGDAELWNQAIAEDSSGRYDPSIGPPGWNFPLHVLERDDQGDPVTLATLSGTVPSPNFSGTADPRERRRAEDAWLDATARTLSTPGELGLIFHQFFRYCSDSPLRERPNLIGSHFGLSDTHQTVYESMERRWVGRLIGDCDDLAEFFQVLTRRQGKLSHVMQLPGHAACGYVERTGGDGKSGDYRFVVLQTGPVLQYTADSMNRAVEIAYRSFDRGEGISHMTTDAVPLLLRFANEETRTPFVLSARIYGDREYSDTMVQVQGYWHENVYSAAIGVMEDMVEKDPEIGSIKELGSLYERVGWYERSAELRRRELELVKDNPQAALSTLLEIAQLHFQDKDREKTLTALGEMEARMQDMIRRDDAPEFFKAMTFRSYWAMYISRLGPPSRAWNLVKYDAAMTKRQLGQIADPVLNTMVAIYARMAMRREAAGGKLPPADDTAAREMRRELEEAFGRGFFKADDPYNTIINRYAILGRYAIADVGRALGRERLLADGPYPAGPRDQAKRGRGVDDEDWKWMRIAPQLYLALGMEMLDREEYPEFYDPEGAKPYLEDVARAVAKGTGLGSDIAGADAVVRSDLTLSFLNRDLEAFRKCMATVKEKNYSSLYDDAAMTFGLHCGLIPAAEFPAWIEVFRQFFPGTQHYFKVVYRAIDKGNYDHALMMAEATARFFPDRKLLVDEAEFVRRIIPDLKAKAAAREKK